MKLLAGTAAILALGFLGQADTLTYSSTGGSGTITGYISGVTSDLYPTVDYDSDGIFGPAGSTETGEPITISYSYTFVGLPGYTLLYDGNDSWSGGPGSVHITVSVGTVCPSQGDSSVSCPGGITINDEGDHEPGNNTLNGVAQNGLPVGPTGLSADGYCFGRFTQFEAGQSDCEDIFSLSFNAAGGSITIDPFLVPNPYPPSYDAEVADETFTFTSTPEPSAFALIASGLCALSVIRAVTARFYS